MASKSNRDVIASPDDVDAAETDATVETHAGADGNRLVRVDCETAEVAVVAFVRDDADNDEVRDALRDLEGELEHIIGPDGGLRR
jgi:hypothetical protein